MPAEMPATLKVLSLFCGCGGLDYGFHTDDAFEVVRSYDFMKLAVDTYNLNYPGVAEQMDVRRLLNDDFDLGFQPDVIIGGPPCQDFSMAGKQVLGERANLTDTYVRIICKYIPSYFVMENVVTIKSVGKTIYDSITRQLKEAGYGLSVNQIYMPDYGVPQKRKRLVIIGRYNGEDGEFNESLVSLKDPVASLREYMAKTGIDMCLDGREHIYRHPRAYMARGVFSIDELYPTVRGCLAKMPRLYKFHPADTAKDRDQVVSPTWTIGARIQTFPPTFKFFEGRSNAVIIGNAVPPLFSKVVAKTIRNSMQL